MAVVSSSVGGTLGQQIQRAAPPPAPLAQPTSALLVDAPITFSEVLLTGDGTLSGTQVIAVALSGSLDGAGALAAVGALGSVASVSLNGLGTLTATGTPHPVASAALSGAGTVAATAVIGFAGSPVLSGAGSLTIVGSAPTFTTAVDLGGDGQLTVTTENIGFVTDAVLTGAGALFGQTNAMTASGVGPLTGTGTLGIAGVPTAVRAIQLSGTGSLTIPTRTPAITAATNLSGLGVLTTAGYADVYITNYTDGYGGVPSFLQSAVLNGTGSLTGTGGVSGATATATLTGQGSLTATFMLSTAGVGLLSGAGIVSAPRISDIYDPRYADNYASGYGTPGAIQTGTSSGTGTLSATGIPGPKQTGAFTGTGTLAYVNLPGYAGPGALSGAGSLSIPAPYSDVYTEVYTSGGVPNFRQTAAFTGTGALQTGFVALTFRTSGDLSGSGRLIAVASAAVSTATSVTGEGFLLGAGIAVLHPVKGHGHVNSHPRSRGVAASRPGTVTTASLRARTKTTGREAT